MSKAAGTVLSWIAKNMDEETVLLQLSKSRVNPNLKDKAGRTPLSRIVEEFHYWKVTKNLNILKMMLAKDRIKPDSADILGRTSLSWASEKSDSKVVDLLL